jgi:hypothetical protein
MAPSNSAYDGAVVRVGPSGDPVVSAAWAADVSGLSWTRWLEGLSPQGDVRWTYPSLPSYGSSANPAEVVRVDGAGNAWIAGGFKGSLDLGAPVGTLTAGDAGAFNLAVDVLALGSNGNVLSGSTPAALTGTLVGDMALDRSGNVIVAGWTGAGVSSQGNLSVTKLGF